MGGTFDPVHFGHLILAENLREELNLEKVIFIPTGISPHKSQKKVTDGEFRYNMLKKAVENNAKFEVSRLEIDSKDFSYTYDTMKKLKEIYKNNNLYFMTGADIVFDLEKWKNSDWLLKNVNFVVATRAGYDDKAMKLKVKEFNDKGANIKVKKIPLVDISSSFIRNQRILGKSIRYLTPDSVCDFIYDNKLYLNPCKSEDDR